MDVVADLPSDAQAGEPVQQRELALHDPAVRRARLISGGVPRSSVARSRPECGRLGNVLRCDTTLRSIMARLFTTGTGDPPTRPGSRLSSLRNSTWMAAEGCSTSGAVPASSPCDWRPWLRAPSALTPIRR